MDKINKKDKKFVQPSQSNFVTEQANRLSTLSISSLKKKNFKNRSYPFKKPFCRAFYGLLRGSSHDTFMMIKHKHPEFIQYLLHDLLRVEGYSETEVAFGLNIPLYVIREIVDGDYKNASREIFLAIIHLYARVFCGGWCQFSEI